MTTTQNIQPPYTKPILSGTAFTDAIEAVVYLGTLPIRASIQFNISNAASTMKSFIDGVLASGTVTVTDYTQATGTVVTVAGHALTEGVEWTAGVSNNATADSLYAAIDALSEVQAANPAAAIITVKAAIVGTAGNSITTTKTGNGITVQQAVLAGGLANAVDGTLHSIALPSHGLTTGLKVNYDKLTGTTLTNLVDNTDYFVIRVDANNIKLATSEALAEAGTALAIAAADTAVGGGSFTLTPTALNLVSTIYGSNDGVNFVSLDTVTSSAAEVKLFQYATPTYAFMKVICEPNDSEATVDVLLHTKL